MTLAADPSGRESLFGDFEEPGQRCRLGGSVADHVVDFLQGLEQDWINSSFGQQVDSALNSWAEQADPAASGVAGLWVDLQRR